MAPTECSRKRNNKLEAFLQRALPNEEYLRIRAYSPCIVDSSAESLTYRNVIITEDRLCLTENPPRTVYTAVNLSDVVAIRVIDEYPWFLRGEDREKCQHIEVVCKKLGNAGKLRKQTVKSVSEQDMRDIGAGDGKPVKVPWRKLVNALHKPVIRSQSDGSNPELSVDLQDEPPENVSCRILTQSMPVVFRSSNSVSSGSGRLTPQSSSYPSLDVPTVGRVPSITSPGFLLSEDEEYENGNGSGDILPRYNRPNSSMDNNDAVMKTTTSQDSLLSSDFSQGDEVPPMFSSLETWPRNVARRFFETKTQSALDHYPSQWRPSSVLQMPRSKSTTDAHMPPRSLQLFPSAVGSISLENNDKKAKNEVLNLYILDPNSSIISSLFTARDNYMIRATLALEETESGDSITKFNKSELLEKLLDELQHELTNPGNNMEELFHLLQELKVAATKHKVLRRLFWKDSSLLQFLIMQLQKLLPNTNVLTDEDDALENREDELELSVLIMHTLSVMFRETEVVNLRWQLLSSNKNKLLRELVKVISSCPKVPLQYLHTTQRMLTSFKEFFSSGWENLPEAEFIKLLCEVTHASVALLFEILFASQQASSNLSSVVTICEYFSKPSSSAVNSFWACMMTQCLSLLTSASQHGLQPQQVVLLYQYLYVLKVVLNHNQKLNASLTYDYNEEFRYYVHSDIIMSQIPESYPIRDAVEQLLHDVRAKVTKKQHLLRKLHELK